MLTATVMCKNSRDLLTLSVPVKWHYPIVWPILVRDLQKVVSLKIGNFLSFVLIYGLLRQFLVAFSGVASFTN